MAFKKDMIKEMPEERTKEKVALDTSLILIARAMV